MNQDEDEEEDLEKQLAKELASMKKPRKQQIFGMLFFFCLSPSFARPSYHNPMGFDSMVYGLTDLYSELSD